MNEEQKERVLKIWQKYCAEGERFINASQEYTQEALDHRRREVILEVGADCSVGSQTTDPVPDLEPEGIQRLLADNGILSDADVREFQGV